MAYYVNWNEYYWCSTCHLKQKKELGMLCIDCKKRMRNKARRMSDSKRELLVVRY